MKVSNKKKTMYTVQNLMKIFLAVLFATAASALCTTDVAARQFKKGTRVDVGAHANFTSGSLRMSVNFVNPSDSPITIQEIKIFRPDGTEDIPDFSGTDFAVLQDIPVVPVVLGPFASKGFLLGLVDIEPEEFLPSVGWFQVHTYWKSQKLTAGLKSWSVTIGNDSGGLVVSRSSQEGFDLP